MSDISDLLQESSRVNADQFLKRLEEAKLQIAHEHKTGRLGAGSIQAGLIALPPNGKAIFIGDLHGDLAAVRQVLTSPDVVSGGRLPADELLVFLGDYGDRGAFSAEVYYVALALKAQFPENVVLLRGNHEGPRDMPFRPYDLPRQFTERFGARGEEVHRAVQELHDRLYHALLVEDRYLVVHGGVPSAATHLNELAQARELHPRAPHLEELLWNDPREVMRGTAPSWRGYGKYFGADVTARLLELTGTTTLIRGHEPCEGVRVNHGGRVLTLFSCKAAYGNSVAAYLPIDLTHEPYSGSELAERASWF